MTQGTRHELSVRLYEVDGPVAHKVREGPPLFAQGRSRLVMLVHGFDNTYADARHNYSNFTGLLQKMFEEGRSRVSDLLAKFYWPGDAKHLGLLSRVTYPRQITNAKKSSERLADFLRELHGPGGGPIQLDFIAHSLGCRMVLETISALVHNRELKRLRIYFGLICLMAPAVQVDMVESKKTLLGRFLSKPEQHNKNLLKLLILHSSSDWALGFFFRCGQWFAGEGFTSEALGKCRPPSSVPGEKVAVDELRHEDYWKSDLSANHVAKGLGLGDVREIPPRHLPKHWSLPERRPPEAP